MEEKRTQKQTNKSPRTRRTEQSSVMARKTMSSGLNEIETHVGTERKARKRKKCRNEWNKLKKIKEGKRYKTPIKETMASKQEVSVRNTPGPTLEKHTNWWNQG